MELLIARNPDQNSTLPYLMRLPLGSGLVFRVRDVWPRTNAVYCHPVDASEWPAEPDLVAREPMRSCQQRGAAIDVVLARARENRSQLVFTKARGRDVVFWQSRLTRKQSRPSVRTPKGRPQGVTEPFEIIVDAHERYAYRLGGKAVTTSKRALPAGDYGVAVEGRLVAAVERKSAADLVASLTNGRLRYALGELAALPRAAVVVEDRYSAVFALGYVRPSQIADGLAELQVRWPSIPSVFCDNRKMAEEYTYRFLAAARNWALDVSALDPSSALGAGSDRLGLVLAETAVERAARPAAPDLPVTPAQVRAWAFENGVAVSDRGRISAAVLDAYRAAHAAVGSDAQPGRVAVTAEGVARPGW